MSSRTVVLSSRPIYLISVLYIVSPALLFSLGWLHWWVSLPVALVLAAGVWEAVAVAANERVEVGTGGLLGAIAVLLLWALLSGVGGFGYQNTDYLKHNAILDSLIHSPWPIVGPGATDTLVYFVAYYLPAALVGKVLGTSGALVAHFLFNALGLHLAAFWFWRFTRRGIPLALAIFLLASGLDALGALIYQGSFGWSQHLEWWGTHAQYSSQGSAYFWVPQHALYSWITVGLILSEGRRFDLGRLALMVGCGVLWSPFAAMGVLVLLPLVVVERPRIARASLVAGTVVGALLSLYVMSTGYAAVVELNDWPFFKYLVFITVEFLIFLPLIRKREPILLVPLALLLTLLPLLKMGQYNDLAMRASLPALFVVWLMVARDLTELPPVRRGVAALLLCVGGITSAHEVIRGIENFGGEPEAVPALADIKLNEQYFGRWDSWFVRTLVARDEGRGIMGSGTPQSPKDGPP